jgi:hypothetical protein
VTLTSRADGRAPPSDASLGAITPEKHEQPVFCLRKDCSAEQKNWIIMNIEFIKKWKAEFA